MLRGSPIISPTQLDDGSVIDHATDMLRPFWQLGWCVERGLTEANACTGIKPPARERSRDRMLDDAELTTVWVAAADLPRVFDRFDRIDEAGVRGEAALGLGLPLTRQFIEAHGGTIDLESKKGKGTTVTLTIPRDSK